MSTLNNIFSRAQSATKKRIVLPEGTSKRVIQAVARLQQDQLAEPILIGDTEAIKAEANSLGVDLSGVEIINPTESVWLEDLTTLLFELRKKKGMTEEMAKSLAKEPLYFADLMVRAGHADGCVAGSVFTTADVVRTAIQLIGVKKGTKIVCSTFIMLLDQDHHPVQGAMLFTDCALMVDPNAEQLAAIAMAAADSAPTLIGEEARVAMLSFSTSGSAKHPTVTKVTEATALVKAAMPDLAIDGEVQFDAALVPAIAQQKIDGSVLKGCANVLVFPSLNAGNIGYKIAERIGGAKAVGPVLQGLAKPANDLSRGCSVDDIYNTVAITVTQANVE